MNYHVKNSGRRRILTVALALVLLIATLVPALAMDGFRNEEETPGEISGLAAGDYTIEPSEVTGPVIEISITSGGADGFVYNVTGADDAELQSNIPISQELTFTGAIPAEVVIKGQSPSASPLKLAFDGLTLSGANAFSMQQDTNVALRLLGTNTVTSTAGAGMSIPDSAAIAITGTGSGNLTAVSTGTGAGIGGNGAAGAGTITINGGEIYAKGSDSAGIGGISGNRAIKITDGTVIAEGSGSNPGIGGASSVSISGGFVVSKAGDPGTKAINGSVKITGGSVYGDTGIQAPKSDGTNVYPIYVPTKLAEGSDLADSNITGGDLPYNQNTITPAQSTWNSTHGNIFPANLTAVLWAPTCEYTGINTDDGAAAANVKASLDNYDGRQWTNSLGSPMHLSLSADGTPNETGSTAITLTFDKPVAALTRANLTLKNAEGAASLSADEPTTSDNLNWTAGLGGVTRQGTVSLTVQAPTGYSPGWALLDMPGDVVVTKNLGLISGGTAVRYCTPAAVLTFNGDTAGTFYYRVVQDGDTENIPLSPEDLASSHDGTTTLLSGTNTLTLKNLIGSGIKTVYFTGRSRISGHEELTNLFTIDIPAITTPLVLNNSNSSATVTITAISADEFKINGLTGEWGILNDAVTGIRFDEVPVLIDSATGTRSFIVNGGNFAHTQLDLTIKNTSITGNNNSPIALTNMANVKLTVEGTNSLAGGTNAYHAGLSVPWETTGYNTINITSTTNGQLTSTGYVEGSGIGGSSIDGKRGGGRITIGGNVRIIATSGYDTGIGASRNGKSGIIRIEGNAYVYATGKEYSSGIGGRLSPVGTQGGPENSITISGNPTIIANSQQGAGIGAGDIPILIQGGFIVARSGSTTIPAISSTSTSGVTITGGNIYTGGSTAYNAGIQNPKDGSGNPLWPVFVPASLVDGTIMTDLDIGGGGLPYTQHTITSAQRSWCVERGNYFPVPATIPATATDGTSGKLAAVIWAPAAAGDGRQNSEGTLYNGISASGKSVGVYSLPKSLIYSTTLSTNVIGIPVTVNSVLADGESNTVTSTKIAFDFAGSVPALAPANVYLKPETTTVKIGTTATATGEANKAWDVTLGDISMDGTVNVVFSTHNYVSANYKPGTVIHKNENVIISPQGGTRYFTTIGGNEVFESTWGGTYYYQYGGTPPTSAEALKESATAAGHTGTMTVGQNTIMDGIVSGSYSDAQTIPVYIVGLGANGRLSSLMTSSIPAYTGGSWFKIPTNTTSSSVGLNVIDENTYRFTGLNGALSWLNGRDNDIENTPVELSSNVNGTRSFVVNGGGITHTPLQMRLNGLTLAGGSPLALTNKANVKLTVDGTNSMACIGVPWETTGYNTINITSTTNGQLTSTGYGENSGIGGISIDGKRGGGRITIGGDVRVITTSQWDTGIGASRNGKSGIIRIEGNAFVYATGRQYSSGIGGRLSPVGNQGGPENSITISGNPTIIAVGGAQDNQYGAGIGAGDIPVVIEGGFIVARSGSTTIPAISSTSGVKITGGNVYAANTTAGISSPKGADGKNVYPLYIPSTLGGVNLLNVDLVGETLPYEQHTVTTSQKTWLTANGVSAWWPTDLAAVLWAPADAKTGTLYNGFTADEEPLTDTTEGKAYIVPSFKTFENAKADKKNILTFLNEMALTQNGAADTVTTKRLTFTLDEGAGYTDALLHYTPPRRRNFNHSHYAICNTRQW
jgi:hypothetical protein